MVNPGMGEAAAGVAFFVALALAPALVRFAIGRDLLDVPNARSSHEVPTPRLGGVAVMAGAWAAAPFMEAGGLLILAGATLAGLIGILDDLATLKFWIKALGQAVVALGFLLVALPQLGGSVGALGLVFGTFWIVALVNAFNFMDGIDGIAGGTAVLNAIFLGALAPAWTGAGLAALAAATAAFLLWNLSPARIFLGDSGSHFLGFFLGATAFFARPLDGSPYLSFVVAVAVFTPFLFDTAYTLLRRARARKNVFAAHREHVYQRITPDAAKHRQVSIVYFALAALSGLGALAAANGTPTGFVFGAAAVAGCCAAIILLPRFIGDEE